MDAEALVTFKCDCGHTNEVYCLAGKPFKYECSFCSKKWLIVIEVKNFEDMRKKKSEEDIIAQRSEQVQKLTDEQKNKLVELLLPYWIKGKRHYLALMVAGALYWNHYPLEDAIAVIKEICEWKKDEEIKDRLRAVEEIYKNTEKRKVVYKMLLQGAGITDDEFEELVVNLLNIIKGSFIVGDGKLYVRKSSRILIKVDFRSAMIYEIYIDKKGRVELHDTIMAAVPDKVEVIRSEKGEFLRITFRRSNNYLLRLEGYFDEIVKRLLRRSVMVTSRRKVRKVLCLIISGMISAGLCEVKKADARFSM